MRWLRLLLLGLASVYPLYWTAQFILFFLPESLAGLWLGQPIEMVGISYLQATSRRPLSLRTFRPIGKHSSSVAFLCTAYCRLPRRPFLDRCTRHRSPGPIRLAPVHQ